MPTEFSDTVVKHEDREFRAPRAPIEETYEEVRTIGKGSGDEETYSDRAHKERKLPESVRAFIDKMEAEEEPVETDETTETAGEEPAELVAEQTASGQGDPAAGGDAKPTEPPAEKPPEPSAAAAEELERLRAANQRLVDELDAERGKTKPAAAVPKQLEGIDAAYVEDPIAAMRRLVAASLGVEDPADKKVDDELRLLYTDLTAWSLGVTPDDNHATKRESARTRLLLEREKRERKAAGETSAEQAKAHAEAEAAKKASEYIGTLLHVKGEGGSSIADEFPMLMDLAETFEGLKPEAALVKVLKHATQTGQLKITGNDGNDLRTAAKMLEDHYEALDKKIQAARNKRKPPTPSLPPSTATPNDAKSSAATPSPSTDTRHKTGARTLTNADASAAPAALPATQPKPKSDERPKFKSDKERREWALRHLDKR